MEITPFKDEHLKSVADIFRIESSKKPYFLLKTESRALEEVIVLLEKETAFVFIVEKEVIGFIACQEYPNKKEVYIDEFWIKKKNQHQGIGKKVMEFIENKYAKEGKEKISLVTNKKAFAVKFYNKIGYQPHTELIFLEKELKQN